MGLAAAVLVLGGVWVAIQLQLAVPAALLIWAVCVALLAGASVAAARATRSLGRWRWVARVALGVVGLVAWAGAVLVLPAAAAYLANNARLAVYADQLYDYPRPPGTRAIDREAEVGLQTGNGDHCDYIATVTLRADEEVSRQFIKAHYAAFAPRPGVPSDPWPPRLDVGDGLSRDEGSRLYAVSITSVHDPNADIRCW